MARDLQFLAHDYDVRHQDPDDYTDAENERLTERLHEPIARDEA